eukprot:m.950252 g.950252  ORF g.950252 m.950252 type:complete len:566 (-) comp23859_c0_seq9:4064-5761(-)
MEAWLFGTSAESQVAVQRKQKQQQRNPKLLHQYDLNAKNKRLTERRTSDGSNVSVVIGGKPQSCSPKSNLRRQRASSFNGSCATPHQSTEDIPEYHRCERQTHQGRIYRAEDSHSCCKEPSNQISRRRSGSFGSSVKAVFYDFFSVKAAHTSQTLSAERRKRIPVANTESQAEHSARSHATVSHQQAKGYRPRSHSTCTGSSAAAARKGIKDGDRKGRSGSFSSGPTRWLRSLLVGVRSRSRSNSMTGNGTWDSAGKGTTADATATYNVSTMQQGVSSSNHDSHHSVQVSEIIRKTHRVRQSSTAAETNISKVMNARTSGSVQQASESLVHEGEQGCIAASESRCTSPTQFKIVAPSVPCLVFQIGMSVGTAASFSDKENRTLRWAGADAWLWEQSRHALSKRAQRNRVVESKSSTFTMPRSSVRMTRVGSPRDAAAAQARPYHASTSSYTHTATSLTAARMDIRGAAEVPSLSPTLLSRDGRERQAQPRPSPRAPSAASCTPSPPVHVRHQPSNIVYRWQLGTGCGARMEARRKELLAMDVENSPALVAEWMALVAMRAHTGTR